MRHDDYPSALVRVVVNVDNLRIGMEAEVELTPRIQGLLASGYLKLIGHVQPPVPPVAELPPPPVEALENVSPEQPVRRKPTKKKAVDDAGSEGSS